MGLKNIDKTFFNRTEYYQDMSTDGERHFVILTILGS